MHEVTFKVNESRVDITTNISKRSTKWYGRTITVAANTYKKIVIAQFRKQNIDKSPEFEKFLINWGLYVGVRGTTSIGVDLPLGLGIAPYNPSVGKFPNIHTEAHICLECYGEGTVIYSENSNANVRYRRELHSQDIGKILPELICKKCGGAGIRSPYFKHEFEALKVSDNDPEQIALDNLYFPRWKYIRCVQAPFWNAALAITREYYKSTNRGFGFFQPITRLDELKTSIYCGYY